MTHIYLLSDASCNPSKNKSIGCYFAITSCDSSYDVHPLIQTYQMNFASSTLAELTTIREALKYAHSMFETMDTTISNTTYNTTYNTTSNTTPYNEITLYVDCKNFVDLIKTRQNKDNLKTHRNYELYLELINLVNMYKTNIVWTKGHDTKEGKIESYQKLFSILDKTTRNLSRKL